MKLSWNERFACEDFKMKVVKFGKWKVEFGMNVKTYPHGWNFKKVIHNWNDFYYHGHIGKMWYDGIGVSAVEISDVFPFLYKVYSDWERNRK